MQETTNDTTMFILIAGGILLIVAISFIFNWRKKRARTAESWTGEVIDKDEREFIQDARDQFDRPQDRNGGININLSGRNTSHKITKHFMSFKKDDGTTVEWEVSDGIYGALNIGDKVIKEPGQYNPRKQ